MLPLNISAKMKRNLPDEELACLYEHYRLQCRQMATVADVERQERYYQRMARLCISVAHLQHTVVLRKEQIPREEGVLYICNHIGSYDQFYIPSLLGTRPLHYLVKEKVTTWPIRWNLLYKPTGAIVVNQESARNWRQAKTEIVALLSSGRNVFIFPEGARRGPDNMGDFSAGAAQVAQEAGCLVATLAIKNCCKFLGGGRTVVCMGDTLHVAGREDLHIATARMQAAVTAAYQTIVSFEERTS